MKKIISLLLIICTFISISGIPVAAATVTGESIVNEALKYEGKVKYVSGGSNLTSGADCSGFIYRIHKNLGVSSVTLSGMRSVRKASFCKKYSSNVADAKPGMILLCNNNSHVMLYIGNNEAIHLPGTGQYCKVSNVKYFSFSGQYDGAYTVEGVSYGISATTTNTIKKPTLNITSYPTSIKQGASYGMRGSVAANGAKTTVKTTVTNSSGKTVLSTSDTVGANSTGNIQNMNVNNKLTFNTLSAGTYTLKIVATNAKGSSPFSKNFTVTSNTTTTKSNVKKPTLSITSYPTSIKKGASYGMRGSVAANGAKTTVKATVTNSSGKTVLSTNETVGANSTGNIRYMNVNNKLTFNTLAKGAYTLKIVASNSAGASIFSKSFTVK